MLKILAIDPGNKQSAYVLLADHIVEAGLVENQTCLERVFELATQPDVLVVCEKIESYGMPVGREVFDTVFFTGRLYEVLHGGMDFVPRKDVKLALCGQLRAKDGNIIQALKDRFGGKPTKAQPNPFYGGYKLKADEWQALALAVVVRDSHANNTN